MTGTFALLGALEAAVALAALASGPSGGPAAALAALAAGALSLARYGSILGFARSLGPRAPAAGSRRAAPRGLATAAWALSWAALAAALAVLLAAVGRGDRTALVWGAVAALAAPAGVFLLTAARGVASVAGRRAAR